MFLCNRDRALLSACAEREHSKHSELSCSDRGLVSDTIYMKAKFEEQVLVHFRV